MSPNDINERLNRLQSNRIALRPWYGLQWTIDQIYLAATNNFILTELAAVTNTMTPEQMQLYRQF